MEGQAGSDVTVAAALWTGGGRWTPASFPHHELCPLFGLSLPTGGGGGAALALLLRMQQSDSRRIWQRIRFFPSLLISLPSFFPSLLSLSLFWSLSLSFPPS